MKILHSWLQSPLAINLIALAGLAGLSTQDELDLKFFALTVIGLQSSFLPIFTFPTPPAWMILLQMIIVTFGILGVSRWIRRKQWSRAKRFGGYLATYCLLVFLTNLPVTAALLKSLVSDIAQLKQQIKLGLDHPAGDRP